jgi:predicted histone-like DNA-binding protein
MTIKLNKRERQNPMNHDERAWYATKAGGSIVDLKRIAAEIEKRTSATRADITSVLISLLELIPEHLRNGDAVKLDNFGIFRVNVSSTPSPTEAEVSARNVKGVKIGFLPSTEMKEALSRATFTMG